MDVISELIGVPPADRDELRRLSDLLVHREEGMDDVPPAGVEAAFSLVTYYADMLAQRRAQPTDDLTSALLDGRGRRRPAHRRRDHGLPVPHGRGRQRDHHQAARQRLVLGVAQPRPSGPSPSATRAASPPWIEETLRYDTSSQMLARITTERRRAARHRDPGRRPGGAARRLGQPRRAGVRRRRPLRPRPPRQRAAADRQLRLRPPLLPGRLAGPARGPGLPRGAGGAASPTTTSTRPASAACTRVNVRGFAALPTTVVPR